MYIAATTMKGAPMHVRHGAGKRTLIGYTYKLLVEPGQAQLSTVITRSHRFWGAEQAFDARFLDSDRGRLSLQGEGREDMSVDSIDNSLVMLERAYVYTQSGVFLGMVEDVYFEQASFLVMQLEVVKRLLFVPYQRLLIARQDIVDIKRRQITVRDAVLEERDMKGVVLPKAAFVPTTPQQTRKQS